MKRLRWILADWLSHLACWLRGNEWRKLSTWPDISGNRAAELREQLWEDIVIKDPFNVEWSESIAVKLDELAQLAGENWAMK